MTAGHCVVGYSGLAVGFGNRRSSGTAYPAEPLVHPELDPRSQENDIAILRFEGDVSIAPVRILTLEEELRYARSGGRDGVAVGWGSTRPSGDVHEHADRPVMLQEITGLPIYTHEDCQRVIEDLRGEGKEPGAPRIHEKILCAGEEGRAIGAGDSGGPLLVDTPQGWAVVGVLSQATRDAPPQTVVYMGQWTRTSYFLDWIFPTYSLHFAHSAVGGGWSTDLVLLNTHRRQTVGAAVQIYGSDGTTRVSERITLHGLGIEEWLLPVGDAVETGAVVVSSPEKLSGFLRFKHEDGAATSVQASPVADAFMVPVSSRVDRVGLAVFNVDEQDLVIAFRVRDRGVYKTIPAQGKLAIFVDELFPGYIPISEALTVRADPPGGQIAVLALELVGGSLVTLPAVPLGRLTR